MFFSRMVHRSYESFDSKLALRQHRYVLIQEILAFPHSPDLNTLDYIWSVIKKVINKSRHPNVTSLRTAIEVAFIDMDSASLQLPCECFRPRIEAIQWLLMEDISNNCVLYGSPKCHIKEFFCNI